MSDVAGVSAETEAPWFSAARTSEADPSMATVRFVHDQLTRQISEYRHSLACLADLRDGLLSVQLHSSQLREELYSAILLNYYRDLLLACLGFKTTPCPIFCAMALDVTRRFVVKYSGYNQTLGNAPPANF